MGGCGVAVLVLYWFTFHARRMIVLDTNTGVVAVPMFPPDATERLSLVLDQRDAELIIMLLHNFAAREEAQDGHLIKAMEDLHKVRHFEAGMIKCDEHPYITTSDLEEIAEDSDIRMERILIACRDFALPWQVRRREARLASPPQSHTQHTEGGE